MVIATAADKLFSVSNWALAGEISAQARPTTAKHLETGRMLYLP